MILNSSKSDMPQGNLRSKKLQARKNLLMNYTELMNLNESSPEEYFKTTYLPQTNSVLCYLACSISGSKMEFKVAFLDSTKCKKIRNKLHLHRDNTL